MEALSDKYLKYLERLKLVTEKNKKRQKERQMKGDK